MTMPRPESYRALIAQLRRITKKFDEAEDEKARFAACREQVRAVWRFLEIDQEVRECSLARPIGHLLNASYDAAQGAAPPLFEHSPTRKREADGNNAGGGTGHPRRGARIVDGNEDWQGRGGALGRD